MTNSTMTDAAQRPSATGTTASDCSGGRTERLAQRAALRRTRGEAQISVNFITESALLPAAADDAASAGRHAPLVAALNVRAAARRTRGMPSMCVGDSEESDSDTGSEEYATLGAATTTTNIPLTTNNPPPQPHAIPASDAACRAQAATQGAQHALAQRRSDALSARVASNPSWEEAMLSALARAVPLPAAARRPHAAQGDSDDDAGLDNLLAAIASDVEDESAPHASLTAPSPTKKARRRRLPDNPLSKRRHSTRPTLPCSELASLGRAHFDAFHPVVETTLYHVYTDGSAKMLPYNPAGGAVPWIEGAQAGAGGAGWSVYAAGDDGEPVFSTEIAAGHAYCGPDVTANICEWIASLCGLTHMRTLGAKRFIMHTDSKLVLSQLPRNIPISGLDKPRTKNVSRRFRKFVNRMNVLSLECETLRFMHVRGHTQDRGNDCADLLAEDGSHAPVESGRHVGPMLLRELFRRELAAQHARAAQATRDTEPALPASDDSPPHPRARARAGSPPVEPPPPPAPQLLPWSWLCALSDRHFDADDDFAATFNPFPTLEDLHAQAADAYTTVLQWFTRHLGPSANTTQRTPALVLYALHPRLILRPTGAPWHSSRTARELRRRCSLFMDGKWERLFDEAEAARGRLHPAQRATAAPTEEKRLQRALREGSQGRLRNARATLQSEGNLPYGEESAQRLAALQFQVDVHDTYHITAEERVAIDNAIAGDGPGGVIEDIEAFDVLSILRSRKRGTAAGPTGLRFEHLRRAAESSDRGLNAVHRLTILTASAELGGHTRGDWTHGEDCPLGIVDAATLIALRKKDNGIRPIGIGGVERRLAGGALMQSVRAKAVDMFERHNQYGFSVGGCEKVVHTVRLTLAAHPDWVVLSCDRSAAFQRASRGRMLAMLHRHFPTIVPYFKMLYCNASPLHYGEEFTLESQWGCQQGCSLGSFLYCLATLDLLGDVQAAHPGAVIVAYADDIYIIAPPAEAAAAFRSHRRVCFTRAQFVNVAKCHAYSPTADSTDHVDIVALNLNDGNVHPADEGIEVLGCPVGSTTYTHTFLHRHYTSTTHLLSQLHAMSRLPGATVVQTSLLILRHCAVPRVTYLLRCLPTRLVRAFAARHDKCIMSAFCRLLADDDVLGLDIEKWTPRQLERTLASFRLGPHQRAVLIAELTTKQKQCILPTDMGGMGLASAELLGPGAHVASWAEFLRAPNGLHPIVEDACSGVGMRARDTPQPLLDLHDAWDSVAANLTEIEVGGEQKLCEVLEVESLAHLGACPAVLAQHTLTDATHANFLARTLTQCTTRDHTRLLSCGGEGAGAFLRALPLAQEHRMSNTEIRDAIRHQMHLPLAFLGSGPDKCKHPGGHEHDIDPFGDQDHGCNLNSWLRTTRHNAVQSALLCFARFAGCDARPATFRDMRLSEGDTSHKSPDIIMSLPTLSAPLLLDVTVAHPLGATYIHCYARAGDAADNRALAKLVPTLYITRATQLGLDFKPFAIETYGAFGSAARDTFRRIVADALARDETLKSDRAAGWGRGALTSKERSRLQYGWSATHIAETGRQLIGVALARSISAQLRNAHSRRTREFAPTLTSPAPLGAPTLSALSYRPASVDSRRPSSSEPVASRAQVVDGGGGGFASAAHSSPPGRGAGTRPRPQPPTPGAPLGVGGGSEAPSPPHVPLSPMQATPLSAALEEALPADSEALSEAHTDAETLLEEALLERSESGRESEAVVAWGPRAGEGSTSECESEDESEADAVDAWGTRDREERLREHTIRQRVHWDTRVTCDAWWAQSSADSDDVKPNPYCLNPLLARTCS